MDHHKNYIINEIISMKSMRVYFIQIYPSDNRAIKLKSNSNLNLDKYFKINKIK